MGFMDIFLMTPIDDPGALIHVIAWLQTMDKN